MRQTDFLKSKFKASNRGCINKITGTRCIFCPVYLYALARDWVQYHESRRNKECLRRFMTMMYGVPIAHRGGSGGGWDVWSRKDLTHSRRNCQNNKTQIHSVSAHLNIKKKKHKT